MKFVSDSALGQVRVDERGCLVGDVSYVGRQVKVHLMADDDQNPSNCITIASAVVRELDDCVKQGLTYVAAQLVELANDWREEDSELLTAACLEERFEFDSLLVYEDGVVEFFFSDGDVFAGHAVIANRAPDGKFSNARFEG
jgi:hypothetical protein